MRSLLPGTLLLALAATACSSAATDDESSDAVSGNEVKVFWADARKLNLSDLSGVPTKLATDAFNDALGGATGARIHETRVYAENADPSRLLPDAVEVHGLAEIVPLLERTLGQPELGTRLNQARLAELTAGRVRYYVESGMTVSLGVDHDWTFNARGLADGSASVGITAGGSIESRIVLASDDSHLEASVRAPLAAAKGLRGFVAPRNIEDVERMQPGEAFALRGEGKLATNLGLGVPLYAAGGPLLSYQVVASAGVGATIEGRVDVQLMRLAGDEVIVDIGVDRVKSVRAHAALEDGFGVKASCDREDLPAGEAPGPCLRDVNLGGRTVNLAKFVERAVERKLNQRFTSRASVSYDKETERVGLTRIRFNLSRGNRGEVSAALAQALKFDLRLAEALSNRELGNQSAPVTVEFDAVRSATESNLDFGFKLAGIDVYDRSVSKKNGTFVLQTPEGSTVLSFDTLEKSRRLFQTEHGYARVGIGALTRSASSGAAAKTTSSTSFFVRTQFGDSHVHDDRFVDGLDAVLRGVGGAAAVASLDAAGGTLERAVSAKCTPAVDMSTGQAAPFDDECNVALLADPATDATRKSGAAALKSATTSLPDGLRELVTKAGDLRLGLQSVYVQPGALSLDGVGLSLTVDQRFDEGALDELTKKSGAEYRAALADYLAALVVARGKLGEGGATRAQAIEAAKTKYATRIDRMEQAFVAGAKAYRALADQESAIQKRLGDAGKRYAATPVGVRFETDAAAADDYAKAVLTSPAQERAQAMVSFFEGLVKAADKADADVRLYKEQAAALPLLSLVSPKRLKVGLTVELSNVTDEKNATRDRFRRAISAVDVTGAGPEATSLSLGGWDLDTVLGTQPKQRTE